MKCFIFAEPPENFKASIEVSSCYCEFEDQILLVKRHPNKSQGNTWGVPAGKLEKGENPLAAVIREVHEEVGLNVDTPNLRSIGCLYARLPHVDYIYHMFCHKFSEKPLINLALDEHLESRWVSIEEARQLPLIAGGHEALDYYLKGIDSSLTGTDSSQAFHK